MSKICSECSIENVDDAKFCKSCGIALKIEECTHFDEIITNADSSKEQDNTLMTSSNFGSKLFKIILTISILKMLMNLSLA